MRRGGCAVVFALAAFGVGAAGASQPRLVLTPASPAAGAATTIAVRGSLTGPVVVRLTSPQQTTACLRLRRVNATLWRGDYRFVVPGTWTLTVKNVVRRLLVAPYPESTFVPLGAPACSPPSPANSITREARGSRTLWALLEGGAFGDARSAVLDGVIAKQ